VRVLLVDHLDRVVVSSEVTDIGTNRPVLVDSAERSGARRRSATRPVASVCWRSIFRTANCLRQPWRDGFGYHYCCIRYHFHFRGQRHDRALVDAPLEHVTQSAQRLPPAILPPRPIARSDEVAQLARPSIRWRPILISTLKLAATEASCVSRAMIWSAVGGAYCGTGTRARPALEASRTKSTSWPT